MSQASLNTSTQSSSYARQFGESRWAVAGLSFLASIFLIVGHIKLPNDGGHALYLPFNSLTWVMLFLIIACGFWKAAQNGYLIVTSLSKQLSLSCILLSVPLFYFNVDIAESSYRIIGLWAGLLVLASLQQMQFGKRAFYLVLVLILVATWIEAGRYWWHMLSVYSLTGTFPEVGESRVISVFQQPNVMASFIGTGLICSGFLLAERDEVTRRPLFTFFLLLSPLVLGQLFHSMGSRAGWYGTGLGMAFLLPILYRRAGSKLLMVWLVAFGASLGLSQLLIELGGWEPPNKEIVSLSGERIALYPQALRMFTDNWFAGVGYGRFEASYIPYVADLFSSQSINSPSIPNTFHPHNEFLLWGVEGGIVPVIGLALAAWAVWTRVIRLKFPYNLALIGLFLPITFHSQVEYPFYHSALHWLIFILLIGLVDNLNADKTQIRLPVAATNLFKFTGIVVPGAASLFLLTTVYSGVLLTRFNDNDAPMSVLQGINNPIVWQDKIDYAVTANLLFRGVASGDIDLMEPYILWGEYVVRREPRPLFYEYLLLAYQRSGQQEKARQTLEEFRYLFPTTPLREIVIQ